MMKQIGTTQTIEPDLIRHMVLNSILGYKKKFSRRYGEIVICCDSAASWRKAVYPYYKASRKKNRDDSSHNWNEIFQALSDIKEEIRDNLPYKVLSYPHAEADDIIGTLVIEHGYHGSSRNNAEEQILIISGDKDFIQLLHYDNVDQYSPVLKKFIAEDNPDRFLRQHIILGDRGDGVPNILTGDTVFMIPGERQKPVSKIKLDQWSSLDPNVFCTTDEMKANYARNEVLIDLRKIPEQIRSGIVTTYKEYEVPSRTKLIPYFMSKRLSKLIESVGDF